MATDVVALLDNVGWTEPRSVHVVGASMGGMIAQELACKISERIRSLLLGVTTPSEPLNGTFPMSLRGGRTLLGFALSK
ncbi:hypothetical protein CYLTODRAFT_473080 [Cylindrobasidium torrendii FP15055 ss-10]|uniref:AB hydrolase-1 domain-containing protein n=1 Tax=Cylindrobasidium torrendii FP15055 ss-10 TaxID=1314674 RepID=A0A0D7BLH1_9AGAR|nr:hypothetical protein CYLTODRAFT_473080 [Cylindrobasidium torrendii FP15055 ss-10]